jgi:peptidoglycan/LPS O-acetylase OafA/YrhL
LINIKHARQVSVANPEKKDPYPFSFMVLIFLAFIIISTIAKHQMNTNAAWGTGACSVALIVAARSRWELKEKWWFWVALCLGAALQLPLIFLMPWAAPHLTGIGAMAFVIPGFIMALGCVFLAERFFTNSTCPK